MINTEFAKSQKDLEDILDDRTKQKTEDVEIFLNENYDKSPDSDLDINITHVRTKNLHRIYEELCRKAEELNLDEIEEVKTQQQLTDVMKRLFSCEENDKYIVNIDVTLISKKPIERVIFKLSESNT